MKILDKLLRPVTFQASSLEAIDVSAAPFAPTSEKYREGFALFCGTGGDIKIKLVDDTDYVTLKNVADGVFLPVKAKEVHNDTTASDLVAVI